MTGHLLPTRRSCRDRIDYLLTRLLPRQMRALPRRRVVCVGSIWVRARDDRSARRRRLAPRTPAEQQPRVILLCWWSVPARVRLGPALLRSCCGTVTAAPLWAPVPSRPVLSIAGGMIGLTAAAVLAGESTASAARPRCPERAPPCAGPARLSGSPSCVRRFHKGAAAGNAFTRAGTRFPKRLCIPRKTLPRVWRRRKTLAKRPLQLKKISPMARLITLTVRVWRTRAGNTLARQSQNTAFPSNGLRKRFP